MFVFCLFAIYVSLLLISEMCPGFFLSCDNLCLYTLMMTLGVICFRVMWNKGDYSPSCYFHMFLIRGLFFLLFTETSLGV